MNKSTSRLRPYRLKDSSSFDPMDLTKLPSMSLSLGRRYPAEFGFGNAAATRKPRRPDHRPKLKHVWQANERYVNQALYAVLLAMPPEAVGNALRALEVPVEFVHPRLCSGNSRKLGKYVGEPDCVVFENDPGIAVLAEIKVGARDRYDFEQFTKYMLYGALLRVAGIVREVAHVLIAPSAKPDEFCDDFAEWQPAMHGRHLTASLQSVPVRRSRGKRRKVIYNDRATWLAHAGELLRDRKYQEANEFDDNDVAALALETSSPNLVPTVVITWDDLSAALLDASQGAAPHLRDSIIRLRLLGLGIAIDEKDFREAVRQDLRTEANYGADDSFTVADRVWSRWHGGTTPDALRDVLTSVVDDEWDRYFEP